MKRILIVRGDHIGDCLLGIPLLHRIRASYPSATIDLVLSPVAAALMRGSPLVDSVHVLPIPQRTFISHFRSEWLIRRLNRHLADRGTYDLACCPRWDTVDSYWSARVIRVAATTRRLAFARHLHKSIRRGWLRYPSPYNEVIPGDDRFIHESDRAREMATYLGCTPVSDDVSLPATSEALAEAAEFMRELAGSGPILAVAPGAYLPRKRWPVEHFATVIRGISRRRPDVRILVMGGVVDRPLEAALLPMVADFPVVSAIGRLSLSGSVAVLRGVDLLLGCDSGPVHLASAAGTRSLVLSWLPRSGADDGLLERFLPARLATVLCSTVTEATCAGGCVAPRAHCILSINPGVVEETVLRLLTGAAQAAASST